MILIHHSPLSWSRNGKPHKPPHLCNQFVCWNAPITIHHSFILFNRPWPPDLFALCRVDSVTPFTISVCFLLFLFNLFVGSSIICFSVLHSWWFSFKHHLFFSLPEGESHSIWKIGLCGILDFREGCVK